MQIQWRKEWTTPSITFWMGIVTGYGIRTWRGNKKYNELKKRYDSLDSQLKELKKRDAGREEKVEKIEEQLQIKMEEQPQIRYFVTEDKTHEDFDPATLSDYISVPQDPSEEEIEELPNHPSNPNFNAQDETLFPPEFFEGWNFEEELEDRKGKDAYILHRWEYENQEERYYIQTTITYYKGDDVLVDEHDVPIPNYDKIIGTNTLRFGHGSTDPSIVYVRSDRLEHEWEIILDHGYYQVEVLGAEIEDILSNEKPTLPKFRLD